MWDDNYRMLEKGEIIQVGDEALMPDDEDAIWLPARNLNGRKASSPLYPAHVIYRRKKYGPVGGINND